MQSAAASNGRDGDKERGGNQPRRISAESTLARLEALLDLVDDVNPALAADQNVIAITTAEGFQRITDLHGTMLSGRPRCWP